MRPPTGPCPEARSSGGPARPVSQGLPGGRTSHLPRSRSIHSSLRQRSKGLYAVTFDQKAWFPLRKSKQSLEFSVTLQRHTSAETARGRANTRGKVHVFSPTQAAPVQGARRPASAQSGRRAVGGAGSLSCFAKPFGRQNATRANLHLAGAPHHSPAGTHTCSSQASQVRRDQQETRLLVLKPH